MPNFPSIYLELQALWRNVRELQNIFSEFAKRLEELERITQCMDYVTSPTNSTVFNCDVRVSGSGTPTLYLGPNTSDGPLNPGNELLVLGKTSDAYMSVTDGTSRLVAGSTSGRSWIGTYGATDFYLRYNNDEKVTLNSTKLAVKVDFEVSGSTILGDSSTDTVKINAITNATTTASHKVITIDENTGIIKKETFTNIGAGRVTGSYLLVNNLPVDEDLRVTGSVVIPSNAQFVKIVCIGGGGGGGPGVSAEGGGGGGGGGAYSSAIYKRSELTSALTASAGSGGAGRNPGVSRGSPGAGSFVMTSNEKVICYAAGGIGGVSGSNSINYLERRGPPGKGEFNGAIGNTSPEENNWDYFMQK